MNGGRVFLGVVFFFDGGNIKMKVLRLENKVFIIVGVVRDVVGGKGVYFLLRYV